MEYILDVKPEIKIITEDIFENINNKLKNNIPLEENEKNTFIDYFVSISRKRLAEYLDIDLNEAPLTNRCDLAQNIIGKLLEENNNVVVYPKESQNVFAPTCKGHSFLVCIIQNTPYLIDLTYRQFFLKENCSNTKYICKDDKVLLAPDPGFFMMKDDISKQIASKILLDGYIKLDEKVAKRYGDSFYLTKTGPKIYSNILGKQYLNALLKENHLYAVNDERFKELYGDIDKKTTK